jgi:hypothetical protein
LLKQLHPETDGWGLRMLVLRSVQRRGAGNPNAQFGYGEVDAASVVETRIRRFEPAPHAMIAVPSEFGENVSARTLSELRTAAVVPREGLRVRVVSSRDLYRSGDGMKLELRASEHCQCLLFVHASDGAYSLVEMGQRGRFALAAGEPLILPRGESESLTVTGPGGSEELLLVCASRPWNLNDGIGMRTDVAVSTQSYQVIQKTP